MFHRKLIVGLISMTAVVVTLVSVTAQTRSLAITHINVIDVVDGRVVPNSTVVIIGNSIASVTPGGDPPANAQVVEGRDKFLIPGLWDMHAHTELTGESWLSLDVANGVTGIRDMGSGLDFILKMRDATATGRVTGPRIFAAGPILDDAPGDWPFRMRVKTADEGRAAVQLLKRRGVDLIKVHDHTPRNAYLAIADEAKRQSLPLAGHIPLGITAEDAIEAGQGNIEHLSNLQLWRPCSGRQAYNPETCRSFFEMLAKKEIWQTPTLAAAITLPTLGTATPAVSANLMAYASKSLRAMWAGNPFPPEAVAQFKANAEVGAVVTKDMALAGVPILAGCDGTIAGYCIHDELAAMVRGGMTPLAALRTATLNPAKYFKLQQTDGSVGNGKRADLVILEGNPLSDIKNVGRIHAVVVAGRLLDRKDLDKMLAEVKARASE